MISILTWFRDGFANWCNLSVDATLHESVQYLLVPSAVIGLIVAFIFSLVFPHSLYSQYWYAWGAGSAVMVWIGFLYSQSLHSKPDKR